MYQWWELLILVSNDYYLYRIISDDEDEHDLQYGFTLFI